MWFLIFIIVAIVAGSISYDNGKKQEQDRIAVIINFLHKHFVLKHR